MCRRMRDQFAFLERFDVGETGGQANINRLIASADSAKSTAANASATQMIRFSNCVELSLFMPARP